MKNESVSSPHDAVVKARKEMIRSAFFALAALVVIIIACVAWFARNTEVTGTTGMISADGSTFELASIGINGAYDNKTPQEFWTEGTAWSMKDTSGAISYGRRTELNDIVQWQLNDTSNIGNKTKGGIHPGSCGKLQFYVIPKVGNELKLKFNINIIPLKENEQGQVVQDFSKDNEELLKLLKGHILFYYENAEGDPETSTWIPCDTGEFEMTFSGKTPQLVTLDWKWPELWENIQGEFESNFSKYEEYFFYTDENNSAKDNSSKYNDADMYIGENVTWLMVQLIAQPT